MFFPQNKKNHFSPHISLGIDLDENFDQRDSTN
jgi:hypothetical protein